MGGELARGWEGEKERRRREEWEEEVGQRKTTVSFLGN